MLLVDTVKGELIEDDVLKEMYATKTTLWRMVGKQFN